MILYIHGFASSGQSYKAKVLQIAFGRDKVLAPTLSTHPREAVEQLCSLCTQQQERGEPTLLIGSSLGGYYATYISHKYGFPAVLVNPSVKPYVTLRLGLGLNPRYTGRTEFFIFSKKDLESFREFHVENPDNSRICLMVQTGDEILDPEEALARFPHARHHVIQGGSHGFDDFENTLDLIRGFYRDQLGEEICSNVSGKRT